MKVRKQMTSVYHVIDNDGELCGSFYFDRSRSQGAIQITCRGSETTADKPEQFHYAYFADIRRDAVNGLLFRSLADQLAPAPGLAP